MAFKGSRASKGAIAAGDIHTAEAAADVLKSGGNAFDAVVAALFASSLAEPVLSSLGGGGFLMAKPVDEPAIVYDFFAQTPLRHMTEADFHPILADFGTVTQEFHIGLGAVATPGVIKGAFDIHRDLGTMPMRDIVAPACALAKNGFSLSPLQAYIFEIVHLIYQDQVACFNQYASPNNSESLIGAGETLKVPDAADFLQALADEGDDLFYRGDVARTIARDCEDQGGHLQRADFERYNVIKRKPLAINYKGARFLTNPPPSVGGLLIGFALKLAETLALETSKFGSVDYVTQLAHVMDLTNRARVESGLNEDIEHGSKTVLDPQFLARYVQDIQGHPASYRGTTHISVIDGVGNAASMTLSNGEGSAYIAPGTGVVLNNMLGEEDINPRGLGNWLENTRMSSMMAPSLIEQPGGVLVALGSGGSNRIRTAILQVVLGVLEFSMPIEQAVMCPRIHAENGLLNIEPGFDDDVAQRLRQSFAETKLWDQQNLFFGGVHAVQYKASSGALCGCGDARRAGVSLVL